MEGDYLELSQFPYNSHQFPNNSYLSPLGTVGFVIGMFNFQHFEPQPNYKLIH